MLSSIEPVERKPLTPSVLPVLLVLPAMLLSSALPTSCGSEAGPTGEACTGAVDCSATGMICAGGYCAPCEAAVQCQADYGAEATCADGVCTADACPAGSVGCPCDGAKCVGSECIAGECVDCERGALGCTCYANGTCDKGGRCAASSICETCPDGEDGCVCSEGDACAAGFVCKNDVCVTDPCPAGTDGCPCLPEETCNDDLRCFDSGLCTPCSNDIVGCPCVDGKCADELVCDQDDDVCREPVRCEDAGCVEHQLCDEQPGLDASCLESCDEGFAWDAESSTCLPVITPNCQPDAPGSILAECSEMHRECLEEDDGAECGGCLPGFTDEQAALPDCRAIVTCAELGCAALNRVCTPETDVADAACGECEDGYMEDEPSGDACVPEPPPNCTPGAVSSILEQCNAANRVCIETEAGAECGGCVDEFSENEFGECIPTATCEELGCAEKNLACLGTLPFEFCGGCIQGMLPLPDEPDTCAPPLTCQEIECPEGLYCMQKGPLVHAECFEDPCDEPDDAWTDMDGGKCVLCDVDCNDSDLGETGNIWPFTLAGSKSCICETEPSYYWDDAPRAAVECDADGDGWVRSSARSAIESADPSMKENARCALRTINRFVLRNEYQQELEIYLCMEAPTLRRADQGACDDWRTLPLYESVRNDRQVEMDMALETDVPAYAAGGIGRRPLASEVNGLTKACTEKGDYNHNGTSDISEWHGMPQGDLTVEEYIFASFSYYIELYVGRWEPNVAPGPGRYVISERSRCEESFPLVYASGDGQYWRQCTRSRNVSYDPGDGPAGPEFGLDFARWSCDEPSGGCPIPPPPTEEVVQAGPPAAHGLCEVPLPPTDEECGWLDAPWLCQGGSAWRGMSHHSQFRCVKVAEESSLADPVLSPASFDAEYRFNQCRIACPQDDPSCSGECADGLCQASSTPPEAGPNPFSPVIACEQVDLPQPPSVGFALALFLPGQASYSRGCIDEWQPDKLTGDPNGSSDPVFIPWRSLCPGWANDPDASIGESNAKDFGALECGCGVHYGGPECNVGCPDSDLLLSPLYDATPRTGYWLCGRLVDRVFGAMDGPQWKLHVEAAASAQEDGKDVVWKLTADPMDKPTDGLRLCQDPDNCTCPEQGPCNIGFVLR